MKRKWDWKAVLGGLILATVIYHAAGWEPEPLEQQYPVIAAWAKRHQPYGNQELLYVGSMSPWIEGERYEVWLPRSKLEVYTDAKGKVVSAYTLEGHRRKVWGFNK